MLFRDSKTVHSTACKLERKISRGASLACVPGGFPVRPSFAFCEYGIEVYSRAKAYPRSNVKKRGRGDGKKHRPSPIVFSIDLCWAIPAADLFLSEGHERKKTRVCCSDSPAIILMMYQVLSTRRVSYAWAPLVISYKSVPLDVRWHY